MHLPLYFLQVATLPMLPKVDPIPSKNAQTKTTATTVANPILYLENPTFRQSPKEITVYRLFRCLRRNCRNDFKSRCTFLQRLSCYLFLLKLIRQPSSIICFSSAVREPISSVIFLTTVPEICFAGITPASSSISFLTFSI